MALNIIKCEDKETSYGPIKEVQANDGNQTVTATIWKKQKDGTEFPSFDSISVGSIIEGNLWNKPGTDKWSIFPAKPKAQGMGGGMGKALMAEKSKSISEAQKNKEAGVKIASVNRMAHEVALAEFTGRAVVPAEYSAKFKIWKQYFTDNWNGSTPVHYPDAGVSAPDPEGIPF